MSGKEDLSRYSIERPRRLRHRRLLSTFVLVLPLVWGLSFGIQHYYDSPPESDWRTAVVMRGEVEQSVTALGKVRPKEFVDVGTQVSGQLQRVHREIGDGVERGDLIAEIDPTVYEESVRTSRANLDNLRAVKQQQQAELTLARRGLDRSRNLGSTRAVSEQHVEQSEAAVRIAEAKLAATAARIRATEASLAGEAANLGYTKIHSPMTGTVVDEIAVEGQTLNASQSAPVIVRVADLETMTVWAEVSEADVMKIATGTPAYFTTLGTPERRWEGEIRQILPTPRIVNDVVLYNVLIDVDNSEQLLMPEMTVQVFFVLDRAEDAPLVPMSALAPVAGTDTDTYRVRVMHQGEPVERTVRIGVRSRVDAEAVEGLAEGDVVVLGPAEGQDEAAPGPGHPSRMPRL